MPLVDKDATPATTVAQAFAEIGRLYSLSCTLSERWFLVEAMQVF